MKIIEKVHGYFVSMKNYPKLLKKRGMIIGDNCEIYKSANFGSEPYLITIGNHVRINGGVQFFTHDGGAWVLRYNDGIFADKFQCADIFGKIIVEDNVHIGTNAMIMPDVRIGKNSIVACGAVVTHDVPSNSIVGGVPARPIESLEEYVKKNKNRIVYTNQMSAAEKKTYLTQLLLNDNQS